MQNFGVASRAVLESIADISGRKQIEFHQSMKKDLQTLDESLASLRTSQNTLQSRIEGMQNDAPDFSAVPVALDQLRDQLAELARSNTVDEANVTDYESPAEANSIE